MFSKKSGGAGTDRHPPAQPPGPASKGSMMASSSTFSVIGADVVIKGDISATADPACRTARSRATSNAPASCRANRAAINGAGHRRKKRAALPGRVAGSITARELVILKSAVIEGDVHY